MRTNGYLWASGKISDPAAAHRLNVKVISFFAVLAADFFVEKIYGNVTAFF